MLSASHPKKGIKERWLTTMLSAYNDWLIIPLRAGGRNGGGKGCCPQGCSQRSVWAHDLAREAAARRQGWQPGLHPLPPTCHAPGRCLGCALFLLQYSGSSVPPSVTDESPQASRIQLSGEEESNTPCCKQWLGQATTEIQSWMATRCTETPEAFSPLQTQGIA